MNFIESHFIEIAFILVFISVVNMVSNDENNPVSIKESNVNNQVVCR